MTTFSAHDVHALINSIKHLSQQCQSKRATFNYHNTQEQKTRYFANYQVISKDCQALLVSVIDAYDNFEDFWSWSVAQGLQEQTLDVIAFAMTRESPHLTTLGWWMSPGIQNLSRGNFNDPLHSIRGLFHQLCNSYSSNEGEKYREPAFFINGQFREGFLHNEVFNRKVNHAIVNIVDDCINNPQATRDWIKKVHDVYQASPTTGQVIKDVLKHRLMDERVEGLEGLREYILDAVAPKGEECSTRCKHIVERLFSTPRGLDLEHETSVLNLNERYRTQAFVADFVGHAQRLMFEAKDEEGRSDAPPENTPNLKNFTAFYTLMNLSDSELSRIAMLTAGEFSLGKVADYEDVSCATRMKDVMKAMGASVSEGLDIRWPNSAVLASVILSLSPEVTAEVAQDSDSNRSAIYTLTRDTAHLCNMQDGRRLDDIMGADLGL